MERVGQHPEAQIRVPDPRKDAMVLDLLLGAVHDDIRQRQRQLHRAHAPVAFPHLQYCLGKRNSEVVLAVLGGDVHVLVLGHGVYELEGLPDPFLHVVDDDPRHLPEFGHVGAFLVLEHADVAGYHDDAVVGELLLVERHPVGDLLWEERLRDADPVGDLYDAVLGEQFVALHHHLVPQHVVVQHLQHEELLRNERLLLEEDALEGAPAELPGVLLDA
mmetsp:Transcript_443/g.494  ORF Transcript_443/g.494 Transcript_443/m.494 type:complete len:218 (+) Transcript_443:1879-2532(+)